MGHIVRNRLSIVDPKKNQPKKQIIKNKILKQKLWGEWVVVFYRTVIAVCT